ncbi:MAG: hypothetical protein K2X39_02470, partial [Silvanigrellaceae bacterium]|nr:hypothetical protein [Silvanigrellaceae bacterium]
MKKIKLELLILMLLETRESISLQQIAEEAGLTPTPNNRRAIQRALANLIQQEMIEAQGIARARVYVRKNKIKESYSSQDESVFGELLHSEKSLALLDY